jgi:hypothetical protein
MHNFKNLVDFKEENKMIQRVGGSKVYIITGSGRDPRLTSTGQSWASLVSSQKYKLYQEAQNQALKDIQYDQMEQSQKLQIQEAMKSRLYGEIEDIKRTTRKLKDAEIKSSQAIQEERAREANRRGRPSTLSGAGTRSKSSLVNPIDKQLALEVDKNRDNLMGVRRINLQYDKEAQKLRDNGYERKAQEQEKLKVDPADYLEEEKRLKGIADKRFLMSPEMKKAELEILTTTGGATRTAAKPIVSATPLDYSADLAALEEERASIEAQLAGIQKPTMERPDLIGRTREVYNSVAPRRKLALDFLQPPAPAVQQVQQAPIEPVAPIIETPIVEQVSVEEPIVFQPSIVEKAPVGLSPSQYVAKEYTSELKGLNNPAKAQKAMELIRDLGESFDPSTEKYQQARKAIIEAYQQSVNPKAHQAIKAGKAAKEEAFPNTPQARLVKSLFNPSSDMTTKKKQELFDNAATELKKKYKDNDNAFQEAMKLLVQLNEQG